MFFFISLGFSQLFITSHEEKSFLSWMRTTGNFYTGDEYHFRFGIFLSHIRYNQEFNRKSKSFKVGLNKFSCYTPQECRTLLGVNPSLRSSSSISKKLHITSSVPDEVDWRQRGGVCDVKDQGNCGSCWAFGAIQAQESLHFITTGELITLSESNLVDCADGGCRGCNGGWPEKAFLYVIQHQQGKFNLEGEYPYRPSVGTCEFSAHHKVSSISDVMMLPEGDEENMKNHIANVGPVAVCVDASSYSFYSYASGVYDDETCMKHIFNHAMGVVGYGVEEETGTPYWIVRNSWGQSWGDQGYIKLFRGHDLCSIADCAFYPIY